ncbi:unnamed protein product [Ectocarpus sp. CCAP 1310/34]|nr:unnamed protein product [Ectocarpus sp. CCAP 1310/34]
MIQLMVLLYNWVWKNEHAPSRWRDGVVVKLFKNGDKTDPGNYRGITLLDTDVKVFCKLLNDRIVGVSEKEHSISEGQVGFRKRGCVDHVFTLGIIIKGRKTAGKPTYCFFLDVQQAFDTIREISVSRMLFADDFVGMSDTPEGLQVQIDAAKRFTDKWKFSANI